MSDLLSESTLSFAAAARFLPACRAGRPLNPSTLWRWFTVGVHGPGGARIRLEAMKIGMTWVTSREALSRFFEATTPKPAGVTTDIPPPVRTPAERRKGHERATRGLREKYRMHGS